MVLGLGYGLVLGFGFGVSFFFSNEPSDYFAVNDVTVEPSEPLKAHCVILTPI